MELAVAAMGSLLPKLGALLTDEYKLQKGLRGEIKFLQAEMESMQAALNRVYKLPAHQIDDLLNIWVRDLKELCYDIEDSVDSFMVRVDSPVRIKPHSLRRFFDRTISLLTKAKAQRHIADDIEDIKKRIHGVYQRKERYNSLDVVVQPEQYVGIDPRLPALYEDTAKLVGINGPAQKLVDLLTRGEGVQKEKLMVVSIVGVGGLGKTTIANAVYEKLGGQFECQAFVSVSLKPNMKKVFYSILRQVSEDKYTEEKDTDELIKSIRKFLINKRYFIVIDDVWDKDGWKIIKCALIDNRVGCRVIVTTRNIDVANFCSTGGEVYELDPLSDEDSKMLLCKRVFNEEDGIYSELEEITKKILKKCGGVPLAIITVSSLLASIPIKTKCEWNGVCNSMGSGLHKDKSLESMRQILYLSYSDLPSYLKPCLLYLSMFPEDYEIQRDDLVWLWIAEGFIDEKQGSNLYDLGERYFNELVNRSMIQPVYMNGSATACRVHDMVLDLIISISGREDFVTILEGACHTSPECKIRRLSLQGSKVDSKKEQMILPTTVNISHVRSLVAFGDAIQLMPPLSRFPLLRVLALKTRSVSKNINAKDLASLHHLRYLELGGPLDTELLQEIGNLKFLRTLGLWGPFKGELPASIVQLRQLENLLVAEGVKLPDGIGNLLSLQHLSLFDVVKSPNSLAELGSLTELRELSINGLGENEGYVKTFVQSLSNLSNLRSLDFGYGIGLCSLDCVTDQWRGPEHLQHIYGYYLTLSRVPCWFSSLSQLCSLSIRVKLLRGEDLELLGALPVLHFLKLAVQDNGTTEERLVIGVDHPFRSLAKFRFHHCTRCWLVFAQGVMPKLERLQLYFEVRKREGGGFDAGLQNLVSLKDVTIDVDCMDARISEVEDVEAKIRDAIDKHPNHPTLKLSRKLEYEMITDVDRDDLE